MPPRRAPLALIILLALFSTLAPSTAAALATAPTNERIPLWPLFYRADTAAQDTTEILWPLWSSEYDRAAGHRVSAVAWPLSRFSRWDATGNANSHVFPVFWGHNRPDSPSTTTAPVSLDSYFFAVPLYWQWVQNDETLRIIPPIWDFREGDDKHNWGAFPLLWRFVQPAATTTVLVPAWFNTYGVKGLQVGGKQLYFKSGGVFPLLWFFNHEDFKAYITIPAWYARTPGFTTFGAFPLFWHNNNREAEERYTNLLLLGNSWLKPDSYSHNFWPLVRFSADHITSPSATRSFNMVFPFWYGKNPEHVYASTFPFAWSWDREQKRMDNWSLVPLLWRFRDLGVHGPIPLHDLNALFPLYGRNTGPEPDQSWFFAPFPLYVQANKGDDTSRYFPYPLISLQTSPGRTLFFIFPLTQWSRSAAPDDQYRTEFSLLLEFLFNWEHRPNRTAWHFLRFSLLLPPLFSYERLLEGGNVTRLDLKLSALYQYTRRHRNIDWSVLLFLLKGKSSPEDRRFSAIMPPFISTRHTPTRSYQLFTPLYYNRATWPKHDLEGPKPDRADSRLLSLFPLAFYERRPADPDAANPRTEADDSLTTPPDATEFALLDPLALLNDDPRIHRHVSALFHLFDYKRHRTGATDFRILWRAYHRSVQPATATTPQRSALEMFPFIDTEKTPDTRRFSLGWRLVDYRRNDDQKSLRLFFLPPIRWAENESE